MAHVTNVRAHMQAVRGPAVTAALLIELAWFLPPIIRMRPRLTLVSSVMNARLREMMKQKRVAAAIAMGGRWPVLLLRRCHQAQDKAAPRKISKITRPIQPRKPGAGAEQRAKALLLQLRWI